MRVLHQLLILSSIGVAAVSLVKYLPEAPEAPADVAMQSDSGHSLTDDRLVQAPARGSSRKSRRVNIDSPTKYNQRTNYSILKAFGEAIGTSWKSTVELIADEERLAYGAIVSSDGWVISKDSQIPSNGKLTCRFYDGRESAVEVVQRSSSTDMVLLRVSGKNLQPVEWADEPLPERGRWVATTNTQEIPIAIGVVSTGIMAIGPRKARMGVELREEEGAVIHRVYYGTGADAAGLQSGDRIRAIDGQKLSTQAAALNVLGSCRAGQSVLLTIQRGEDEVQTNVQMMDFAEDLRDETEMEVNGSISARSSGFSTVFVHDTVLQPNQCGGPLVDLNGRVVGLNIARAGRVSSYALPTSLVRVEVDRMLSNARAASPVVPAGTVITSER